jgi:hypothetical protein
VLVPSSKGDFPISLANRRAYFGRDAQLNFQVIHANMSLVCSFEKGSTIVLGRGNPETDISHLDLAPFAAKEFGVSRQHARVTKMTAIIMVEDLGTLNGTFINNEKLMPGQGYVLCEGDYLRLGGMELKTRFKV